MKHKIFIDGEAGTTGLNIRERLKKIADIELLHIADSDRKNIEVKRTLFELADVVILCLHDDSARESVALIDALQEKNGRTIRIIDTSTAHRTDPNWVYGFAEISIGQRKKIARAKRVSNPGCYATGVIALLRPLRDAGLIVKDCPISITAISGYSGGGRAMIELYEAKNGSPFEFYGLDLNHKHLPEIMHHSELTTPPIFIPSVVDFAQGMMVQIPLHGKQLSHAIVSGAIREIYQRHYGNSEWIKVLETPNNNKLGASEMAGRDDLEIYVCTKNSNEQPCCSVVLVARLDNLGKGASGAAVQNLLLMLGIDSVREGD
jgi:N-acetyl-gamma-glutamyl-phosphate reductase